LGGFETSIASADSRLIACSAAVWTSVPEPEPAVVEMGDVNLVTGADAPEELFATVVVADVVWPPDELCPEVVFALVFVLVGVAAQRRLRATVPVDACLAVRLRATHVREESAVALEALRFGVVVAVVVVVVVDGVLVVVVGALVVAVGVLLVVVVGALVVVVGVLVVVDAVVGVVTGAGVVVVTVVDGVVSVVVVDVVGVVSAVELLDAVVVVSVVGVVSVVVPDVATVASATVSPRPSADAGPIAAIAGATAATATAVATRTR